MRCQRGRLQVVLLVIMVHANGLVSSSSWDGSLCGAPKALARAGLRRSLSLFATTIFLVFSVLVRSQSPLPLRPDRASSADLHACMVVQVVASTATAAAVAITHGSARVRAPGELSRPARK